MEQLPEPSLFADWQSWGQQLNTTLALSEEARPKELPRYAKAKLPPAPAWTGSLIFVSDEVGGATIAFSDGTNWRRVQDRVVVS